MKLKKRILIGTMISLSLISACSSSKTYPSIDLPYTIVNEEVETIKEKGLEEYSDYQKLKSVNIRELTQEENERFLERIKGNNLNDLNGEYSIIEFDFGDVNRVHSNQKSFIKFDEEKSYFVYDDEILQYRFYQIPIYKEKELLKEEAKDSKEKAVIYGEKYKDLKILVLMKNEYLKKGLQMKTTIDNETIYIDIK